METVSGPEDGALLQLRAQEVLELLHLNMTTADLNL